MGTSPDPPMAASTNPPTPVPSPWTPHLSEMLITPSQIATRLSTLAAQLSSSYASLNPVLVVVLKGSFMFAADLSRALSIPHSLEFIRASSYQGTQSMGHVTVDGLENVQLTGKHVLVIEDIVDTGLTLRRLFDVVQERGAASVKCCSFLEKETTRRTINVPHVDYVAFRIPDKFVVGYGLDVDQRFRHLPFVGVYKQ